MSYADSLRDYWEWVYLHLKEKIRLVQHVWTELLFCVPYVEATLDVYPSSAS